MRVVFKGSAETVISQMRTFLSALRPTMDELLREHNVQRQPAAEATHVIDPPADHTKEIVASMERSVQKAAAVELEKLGETGNAQPQKSDEGVCRFCARYSIGSAKRLASHESHCKENPDRVPHPREGQKLNPGLRAYLDRQKEAKSSQPTNSPDSQSSCANETSSTTGRTRTIESLAYPTFSSEHV